MEKPSAPDPAAPALRDRRALLERILASHSFETSPRQRELLRYLSERGEAHGPVREQDVGVAVFGRPAGYDTSHDTLVRVQISQLRKRLQQYFEEEAPGEPWQVWIPKGHYALQFGSPTQEPAADNWPEPARAPGFWLGLVSGLVVAAVVFAVFWAAMPSRPLAPDTYVAKHPLWGPFANTPVTIAMASPLFFFSEDGWERDFKINYAEDLADAPKRLLRSPATPIWDRWVPFDEARALAILQAPLLAMGSRVEVRSARSLSVAELRGRKSIVLGNYRGAPVLAEALKDLNFQPAPRSHPVIRGILNAAPRAGEPPFYSQVDAVAMERGNEVTPDYALVTSMRTDAGGEFLSVFGNRGVTTPFVVQKLLDAGFLRHVDTVVFGGRAPAYRSLQLILRVDYSKGVPTGAIPLAHRVNP